MSNRIYPHPIIAREGWPILAGALIAVIVSWMLDLGIITFLFFVFLVFAFQFFRDPAREAPEDPRAVVSPVDGRVCKVEKCTNPETGEDAVKVSIFMNVFNVHSQKSPVAGVVEKVCPRSISGNVLDVRWLDPVDSTSTASTRLVLPRPFLPNRIFTPGTKSTPT